MRSFEKSWALLNMWVSIHKRGVSFAFSGRHHFIRELTCGVINSDASHMLLCGNSTIWRVHPCTKFKNEYRVIYQVGDPFAGRLGEFEGIAPKRNRRGFS